MQGMNIAIVGATGMVGRTFLKVLEERNFPIANLYPFSSKRSAGSTVTCQGREFTVEVLDETSFDRDIDIALFSAGGELSKKFAPIAAEKGVIVVDNSSAWRMDPEVPLIVPEVNPTAIHKHKGIIANPNCSTIQAMVALKPLHDRYGIDRIIFSTYQAVSGSGVKGVRDLEEGIQGKTTHEAYPHPIYNNCLPHIDVFEDNGYTKEEMKMIKETRKILDDDSLRITATCVRVPVFDSHSESVNVSFKEDFDLDEVRSLLAKAPGILLRDDVSNNVYPLASEARGTNEVYVGRLRRDESADRSLNFWVVADNIRKGAATNTVQIAELLLDTL